MQPSKKFAFDVGITFLASVITLPLGFVIIVLLGRYLGAGDLGLYRMTSTIYGIAMLFATIGIPAAMVKYVAEFKNDRTKLNQMVSSGIITSLFLGIGFIALFYFTSGIFVGIFNMPGLSGLTKILSPIFPFALVGGALLGLLNGLREMKKYATATIVQSVLMVIITVSLIYYGFGVAGAVIGIVLSSVGNCLYLIFVSRNYFEITFSEYVSTTKKMLRFGAQMFASNAANLLANHADILFIGYFLTTKDVGYYSVAISIAALLLLVPQAVQIITYPATSEYWSENNNAALNRMVDKSMKYCTCILLFLGLCVGFFAKNIVITLFGNDFIYAVSPLLVLLIARVIRGGTTVSIGGTLAGAGRPDLALKFNIFGLITNVALNILLIPTFGILGAAIATSTSLLLGVALYLFFVIKLLSITIDVKWYLKATGITLAAIILFLIGMKMITIYLVGGLILCIFMVLIFKFLITKEDRNFLNSLVNSVIIKIMKR